MPNYHLAFKKGKDSFKHIPDKFNKLQIIDEFTTGKGITDKGFENEQKLREYLAKKYVPEGYLDLIDIKKKIVISYKNNGVEKYLHEPFGVAYRDDFKFFDDQYLRNFIQSQKFNTDFISSFYNKFKNYYRVSEQLNVLVNHVNSYYNNKALQFSDGETNLENIISNDLNNIFERLIYDSRKNKIGEYESVFSYLHFHCLAMFCSNYYKKLCLKEEKEEKEEYLEAMKNGDFKIIDDSINNDEIDDYVLDEFGIYDEDFKELSEEFYQPDFKRRK